ncbi:MAG TPA: DUF4189 domain-containing protein [Xanthobacteraceae bacterium]|nr:DUF4189 domain-containing protein [Xanthobacteraceae bacterium]
MSRLRRLICCDLAAAALLCAGISAAQAAGAFAIGACGAYGFAYDYQQAEAAKNAAQEKCSGSCEVVPVHKACAAFAIDGTNACGAYGYATRPRLGAAQNTALQQCYQFGGRECVIRAWICDAKD